MIPNESALTMAELRRRSDWQFELYTGSTSAVIGPGQFLITGNSISASSGSSGLSVGDAICRSIQLKLVAGTKERCLGKTFTLRASLPGAAIGDSGEAVDYKIDLGRFTITEEKENEDSISLKGYDAMLAAEVPFVPKRDGDLDAMFFEEYFMQACDLSGIPYDYTTDIAGNKHVEWFRYKGTSKIYKYFRGMTCRQVLASVAGMCGGNIVINRSGKAEFVKYKSLNEGQKVTYDVLNPLSMTVQSTGHTITGVTYSGEVEYGEDYEKKQSITVLLGNAGYTVDLSGNPFFGLRDHRSEPRPEYWESVLQGWMQFAYEALAGLYFNNFDCTIPVNPLLEFMDGVTLYKPNGTFVTSYITDVTHTALGTSVLRNSAEYSNSTSAGSLGSSSGSSGSGSGGSSGGVGIRGIMFNNESVSVIDGVASIDESDPSVEILTDEELEEILK